MKRTTCTSQIFYPFSLGGRTDSDIVTPYEKFVPFDPLVKTIKRNYAWNKTKMVAWFVSNCYTSNNRLQYGKELQKHIEVCRADDILSFD